jgi:hydroxyacylglutathione hydrolase
LPLGPFATNCFIVNRSGSGEVLVVDPGDEPDRVTAALSAAGQRCVAILVTHAHLDHIGAVGPLARAHGAPVYISNTESHILEQINQHLWPGVGPFQPYTAEHSLRGGERLSLAGLDIEVYTAPGHSPGSLVYAVRDSDGDTALFVGDVIFQGSVGRTDLDGGSWPQLEASIISLFASLPLDAPVYSGHTPPTTLAHERATNPFLDAVRAGA